MLIKQCKSLQVKILSVLYIRQEDQGEFGIAIHRTKEILDYVYTDVWGSSKNASLEGKYYFFSFVNNYSRRNWVYIMSHKSEVLSIFVEWRRRMELQTGRKIKIHRFDNRGE